MNDFLVGILAMLLGVLVAGMAQILLKKAAQVKYGSLLAQYLNIRVIAGYSLLLFSSLCSVYGYRTVPLSMGPVWDAAGQIIVVTLSGTVLHERLTKTQWVGFVTVILGILIFIPK